MPTADVACQTDRVDAAPLPLQYPSNLIYAQSMLAVSINQLQQLELCTAQLRFHLRERELQNAAVDALHSLPPALQAGIAASWQNWQGKTGSGLGSQAAPAGDQQPSSNGAAVGAESSQTASTPANAMSAAQIEQLRAHRRRLAAVVKVAVIMLLLEFRIGWFFLYFFAVFLYIGGMFDPMIEWFQQHSTQTTLEQQLAALRTNQDAPEAVPSTGTRPASQDSGTGATARAPEPRESTTLPTDASTGAAASAAEPRETTTPPTGTAEIPEASQASSSGTDPVSGVSTEGAQATSVEPSATANALDPDPKATASATATGTAAGAAGSAVEEQAVQEQTRPAYAQRFIYQLFVMFFMTLLPWWSPDPRYL